MEMFALTRTEAEMYLQQASNNLERAISICRHNGHQTRTVGAGAGQNPLLIADRPHNGQAASIANEDEELQKAIQASLQSANNASSDLELANIDPELAAAIEASKQTSTGTGAKVIDLTGDAEDEMQGVLLASLQTAQGRAPIVTNDPSTLRRLGDLPVGLKNVGNTCYLNSLIQTYFMIPILRKAVLSYKPAVSVSNDDHSHKFMIELQKLFSAMVLSNQRFVDPSSLLKAIIDEQGKPVNIGAQEDASEFNDIFIMRLTKGLELAHPSVQSSEPSDSSQPSSSEPSSQPPSQTTYDPLNVSAQLDYPTILTKGLLQRMFLPKAIETLRSTEADDSPIEITRDNDFGRNFLLPVGEDTELFEALDQFMSDEIPDYETPKGHKAPAHLWKWLKYVPEVLVFQEQRAVWSADGHQKANYALKFPETLYMDRYLEQNKETVTSIRQQNDARRAKLNSLKQAIKPYVNFEDGGIPLDKLLKGTVSYLNSKMAQDPKSPQIQQLLDQVEQLKRFQEEEAQNLQTLQQESDQLQAELDQSYSSLSTEPYRLFAVWMHAGAAISGHYWACINDPISGEWFKFNDTDSSRVELSKVLEDAYGGKGVTSAYFVIYMKESLYNRCKLITDKSEGILPEIRQEIIEKNLEFDKKEQEFRENGVDGKIEKFVKAYEAKLTQTEEYATKFTMEKDMRYYSIFAFLLSVELPEESKAMIASEIWLRTFQRGIGKDQDSPAFQKLISMPVPGTNVLFKAVGFNENEGDKKAKQLLDGEHNVFRSVFMFIQAALNLMLKPDGQITPSLTNKTEAMRYLYLAYLRNQELKYPNTQRTDIVALLQVAIIACLQEAIKLCQSNLHLCVSILSDIVYVVLKRREIAADLHPIILDKLLTEIPELNPAFNDDRQAQALTEMFFGEAPPSENKWTGYPVPAMPTELGKWEELITQTRDVYESWKKSFAGLLPSFGLQEVDLFNPNSQTQQAAKVEVPKTDLSESPPKDQMEISPSPTEPVVSISPQTEHENMDSVQISHPTSNMETDAESIVDTLPRQNSGMDVDVPEQQATMETALKTLEDAAKPLP